jgi:hypothetical protein
MSATAFSSAASSAAAPLSAAAVTSAAVSSPRAPSSPQRIAANRQNARKSTGPKTKEGKAKSSLNASSHRIFNAYFLQRGEDEAYFLSFRQSLLQDLFPHNFLELAAADRIIALHWNLRRLQSAQLRLNITHHHNYRERYEENQEILENKRDRYIANCEKFTVPCTEEDLAAVGLAEPDTDAPRPTPSPGYFLAESLLASQSRGTRFTPEERLLNIEAKLHALLAKAQKDYRQLQKDRRADEQAQADEEDIGQVPFSPFVRPEINNDPHDLDDLDDQHNDNVDDNDKQDNDDQDGDQNNDDDTEPPATPPLTTATRATPTHAAPQGATIPPTPRQNEATCQSDTQTPPNSFGRSPPRQKK